MLLNTKSKYYNISDFVTFIQRNNCLLFNYTTKTVSRFGDVSTTISTAEVMPRSEYSDYIYENLTALDYIKTPLAELSKEGSVYLYNPQATTSGIFQIHNGLKWSGAVSNNKIDGQGVGFSEITKDVDYLLVSGTFKSGVPQGKVTIRRYKSHKYEAFNPEQVVTITGEIGGFSDGLASFQSDGKYGFIDTDAKVVISPIYASVEDGFERGRARVYTADKKEIWIDKTGKFVDYTSAQKKLDQDAALKKKWEEEAAQKRKEEEEKKAKERYRERLELAKALEEGDVITYSYWQNGFLVSTHWNISCYVEKNLNGKKIQVRVAEIKRDRSEVYSGTINGRTVRTGDIIWVSDIVSNELWTF